MPVDLETLALGTLHGAVLAIGCLLAIVLAAMVLAGVSVAVVRAWDAWASRHEPATVPSPDAAVGPCPCPDCDPARAWWWSDR